MQSHSRFHTDERMHMLRILPAYDISYDVISMGRRRLSYSDSPQSHNTTSNTHKPHHSTLLALLSSIHSPCPPPHHSSLSFLPWHQPGSLHELHLYRTNSWSVAPQMTLPAARSRSAGPSLHVVLHLGYPITSEKYWCEWGPYIFEITLGGRGKHM